MGRLSTVTAIKEYDKLLKENGELLNSLEERATVFLELIEQFETAESNLRDLELHNEELHESREALRTDYAEAIFEDDAEKITGIHAAREALDNEIADIFEDIQEVTTWIGNNAPDVEGMSEIVAAEGLLPQLSLYSVIEQLRTAHKRNTEDMQSRRVPLSRSLNEYLDDVDIEAAKRRLSHSYKANQESLEARRADQISWEQTVEQLPPSVRHRPIYQQREYAAAHGLSRSTKKRGKV
jgi:hypothetical protein